MMDRQMKENLNKIENKWKHDKDHIHTIINID